MQLLSKSQFIYGIFLSISSLVFLLYVASVGNYLTRRNENTCDMTYMFEYPQYVRIGLNSRDNDVSEDYLFPRFQLFAYGEGFVTERLRKKYFSGIPVLFIPGNAGSHEQARSLASVSLRKSLKGHTPFHFDYFTISFGKDYSAIYGGVLQEQTNYVAKCIQTILSLYKDKEKSIILIGHSMGGIIAKGSLLQIQETDNVASILITLATPHKPLIFPDYTFLQYYKTLTESMINLKRNGTTVISISGGPRDILIPSLQTFDEYADLNVLTTSIPGVWRSIDHLCILWCKQLILNIVRSLFDSVDTAKRPASIFKSHDRKMKAFNWHFYVRNSFEKHLPRGAYEERVKFRMEGSEWIEDIRRQYAWSSKNYTSDRAKNYNTVYLMIRLSAPVDTLSIDAMHLKNKDWIFACSASNVQGHSRVCSWGWNLSNQTRIMPGLNRKARKYSVDLNLNEIRALNVSHVIVKVSVRTPSRRDDNSSKGDAGYEDDQLIQVDAHLRSARHKRISDTRPWISGPGSLRYQIELDGVTDVVSMHLNNLNCPRNDTHPRYYLLAELQEPWAPGSGQFHFFTDTETSRVIKLQMAHAQQYHQIKSQSARLKLFLDPACTYTVRAERGNLIERISCLVRDRWPSLYPITIGLLLLSIGQRMDSQNLDNISITAIIVIYIFLYSRINLSIELYVCITVLHLMAVGVCLSVVFFGSVAHSIAVRFLARAISFSSSWSDWLLGSLINQLPIVSAGILLSIIPATCGALAMLLSVVLHFLRLARAYDDYLEELLFASLRHFNLLKKCERYNERSSDLTRKAMLNQVILFIFWCFAALPAVPTVLVWARNFSFSTRLITEDQVFLYSWIAMVACGTSGLVRIPTEFPNNYKTKVFATLIRCLGWLAFIIPTTSNAARYYWCFPPCLSITALLISLNSLLA